MKAALITDFGTAPAYRDVPDPEPRGEHDVVVDVLAAGLHPRVRSQADGSHYTSDGALPLVPGIDGVGRGPDGVVRYFVLPDTTLGAMAERTVVDVRRTVPLGPDADPVRIAAAMNPAMSSWVALRRRVAMPAGAHVVVLGATGNAGRLAIQVARRLGAGRVTGVGRDVERLARLSDLGVDDVVTLCGPSEQVAARLGEAAASADVVLDYLWGTPTADALRAIVPRRRDDDRLLTWVQVGSVAGLESPIPSAALRATNLRIVGSGQGSVSTRDIVDELADLAAEVEHGGLRVDERAAPLADVAAVWAEAAVAPERIVLVP